MRGHPGEAPQPPARVLHEHALATRLGGGRLPARLVPGVGVGRPIGVGAVPVPLAELDVQLRVRPHRQVVDRVELPRRQAGPREVDAAEHREREREDDAVGRRLEVRAAAPRERADARAARPAAKRHELGARLDDPGRDARGERGGHLVVSSTDVELLVGAGQREVAAAVEPEQVDDVERALAVDVGAVLADARVGDERAEPRAEPAGERPLDPLLDRHPVERAAGGGVAGVRRGIAGRAHGRAEDREDLGPVGRGRRERIAAAVEARTGRACPPGSSACSRAPGRTCARGRASRCARSR